MNELQNVMIGLGYKEHKGSGSRRKFIHPKTNHVISLHEPHPSPILKSYMIDIVINELEKQEVI